MSRASTVALVFLVGVVLGMLVADATPRPAPLCCQPCPEACE